MITFPLQVRKEANAGSEHGTVIATALTEVGAQLAQWVGLCAHLESGLGIQIYVSIWNLSLGGSSDIGSKMSRRANLQP